MTGVLRDREFLRYFLSRQLSVAGSIVTLVTLPIIVYRTSGSASLTALVAACEAAPYLLFGLFSGALTDRWNRKKVMVAADVVSALLVATIPLADLFWHLTVPHVLAVAFLGPTVGVFFDGAVFGALPMLVGRERIAEANSVAWAAASVVEMVMPSVVGVLLAFLHPAWLLGFDALTFVLSAVLIAGIARPMYDAARERPPLTARQIGRDIREGLEYLVHHPGVRTFTIIGFLQCVGAGGFVALMVVWIDQRLDIGTEGLRFGLVFGAWSVGGLAASLALPWLVRRVAAARIALFALAARGGGRRPRAVRDDLVGGRTRADGVGRLLHAGGDQLGHLPPAGHPRAHARPRQHGGPDAGVGDGLDRWCLPRRRPGGLARPGADARRAVVDRGPRGSRRVDLARCQPQLTGWTDRSPRREGPAAPPPTRSR